MASTFTVVRSTTVDAAPAVVYGFLSDFHEWTKWTPWEDPDLEMTREYSGAPSGLGAEYSWVVVENGGSGRMAIVDAAEPSGGKVHIEFLKPTSMTIDLTFALAAHGTGTEVTWTMEGKHNLMTRAAKATGMLDKTAGKELERGLSQLKEAAEAV